MDVAGHERIVEPRVGVEPTTCRLRIGCSTTELPRPCLIIKDLPACTDLLFINCHQTAINTLFDLRHGLVQIRRVHNVSNVDSVRCPEIFIAILRGTPDRMRFLTPLRRKS